ncbi:DedA family protein [Sphingomonas sp. MG17]|jgi:membrane protein YqaA with SNARE-associated domain|uniref:DedA family protein n=1 Tax=Sphingomonas tagetis TaxID=2949092 RepID=A0A9X2KLV0_9SPHN|nr:YqaA family protein [Sphingomonas tagetis]MCP3731200.1 DedA family protein [Sphingomonas tagetis]
MFRALYDWTLKLAGHRHADRYMAAVSFAESSFFPIPPDVMLVPMILARREQAYRIAAICTISSVLGAMLGYGIGYFLYESVGKWLLDLYHLEGKIAGLKALYDQYGAAVILIKGLTPIPFKLVTIASGIFTFNFPLFVILASITRGARFFLVAYLLKRFGEPVQRVIEERMNLIGWVVLAALIGGFAVVALI